MNRTDELTKIALQAATKLQQFFYEYGLRQNQHAEGGDWLNLGKSFQEVLLKLWSQPEKLWQVQTELWQKYSALWQTALAAMTDETSTLSATLKDKRFLHKDWQTPWFYFLKEAYLLLVEAVNTCIKTVEGVDEKTQQAALFYARQLLDAFSPSNFIWTNPEVLQLTVETAGANLLQGLDNALADLKRHPSAWHIKMTDFSAFKIGENIAVTPGEVIYQNKLMQLIQYTPTTPTVYARPLLIVPPWINKYYILDLSQEKSLVKWLVDAGFTVFMISWVNPDKSYANTAFEDYLLQGPLTALTAIEKATGSQAINTLGFCIGGTLLASSVAYLAAHGDTRIKSATYMATLLDFSTPGELGVFISKEKMALIEAHMANFGYLPGHDMAMIFNLLRDNDLVWPYYVNNYLKGKQPAAFDLLYWNSDFTNLPIKMYQFYLTKMYLNNLLSVPDGITLADTPISLKNITTPTYMVATKEDHIAPWQAIYRGVPLFSGPVRFVLGASGHIAGIINPPTINKYNHWVNEAGPATAAEWLATAVAKTGSWWLDWQTWLTELSGKQIPAPIPGAGGLPAIEPAPGSYVRAKAL